MSVYSFPMLMCPVPPAACDVLLGGPKCTSMGLGLGPNSFLGLGLGPNSFLGLGAGSK